MRYFFMGLVIIMAIALVAEIVRRIFLKKVLKEPMKKKQVIPSLLIVAVISLSTFGPQRWFLLFACLAVCIDLCFFFNIWCDRRAGVKNQQDFRQSLNWGFSGDNTYMLFWLWQDAYVLRFQLLIRLLRRNLSSCRRRLY